MALLKVNLLELRQIALKPSRPPEAKQHLHLAQKMLAGF